MEADESVAAGISATDIVDGDVRGLFARPDADPPFRGVVALGGSGGRVPDRLAIELAERGFACLGLAYFGLPGLKSALAEIPVELVEAGARWLAAQESVGPGSIAILGVSKGAELALLAASLLPDLIQDVVAVVPSNVVFAGVDRPGGEGLRRSSWTWRGRPLVFASYDPSVAPLSGPNGARLRPLYEAALANAGDDAAAIPVEQIAGRILLVSGEDDQMWPSTRMAEAISNRLERAGRRDDVEHVRYPGAGHAIVVPRRSSAPAGSRPAFDFGGSARTDRAAAEDAWPRIATFLHEGGVRVAP